MKYLNSIINYISIRGLMMSKKSSLLFYKPMENTLTSIEQQIFLLMCYASVNSKHQHSPSPRADPRGIFLRYSNSLPLGKNIFAKLRPRGQKNRQKPRPWGQFCHDRETICIFLVLFFSLAFFEFFSKIIKLANTKFL